MVMYKTDLLPILALCDDALLFESLCVTEV